MYATYEIWLKTFWGWPCTSLMWGELSSKIAKRAYGWWRSSCEYDWKQQESLQGVRWGYRSKIWEQWMEEECRGLSDFPPSAVSVMIHNFISLLRFLLICHICIYFHINVWSASQITHPRMNPLKFMQMWHDIVSHELVEDSISSRLYRRKHEIKKVWTLHGVTMSTTPVWSFQGISINIHL